MNRNRSYSLPGYELSHPGNPLLSLWASMSRPPVHSPLELSPFHDDSPSQLWNFDDQSSYPTPLEKSYDHQSSQLDSTGIDQQNGATESSLFESMLVANSNGLKENVHLDEFSSIRHRSCSLSCAVPRTIPMEKTIKCPFCDKMFYKKYNLKSHLVSHSSNIHQFLIYRRKTVCLSSL